MLFFIHSHSWFIHNPNWYNNKQKVKISLNNKNKLRKLLKIPNNNNFNIKLFQINRYKQIAHRYLITKMIINMMMINYILIIMWRHNTCQWLDIKKWIILKIWISYIYKSYLIIIKLINKKQIILIIVRILSIKTRVNKMNVLIMKINNNK